MSSKFELQRQQFATGLEAVAVSLRNCAQFADAFAKIVADTPYSPESAALLQGASESGKGKRKAAHEPDEGDVPKKRKRITKPKDPNAPKRPASSYILFQNDVRKELKERHPNMSNSDLMSLISEQWKKMSQEAKETYNQRMKNAKAQYSEDKKAYDSRHQVENELPVEAGKPLQKEGKSRSLKPSSSRSAENASAVPPRLRANEVFPSSESSEDEESDDEHGQDLIKKQEESESIESSDASSSPATNRRRTEPKNKKTK